MKEYDKTVKPDECFLLTVYISRKLAYPVTLLCRRMGLSASFVTVLGGMLWVVSVPAILLAGWSFQNGDATGGWTMLLLSALLWNAGCILDVVDGSLARLTGASSLAGAYLDFFFHLLFIPMYLASIGAFLYLVSGSIAYLVLAILSVGCNWGVSIASKDHILCVEVAGNEGALSGLSADERYQVFIDSVKTRNEAACKRVTPLRTVRYLVEELICFPGQYALLGLLVLGDLLLWPAWQFPLLKIAFCTITVVMSLRVPFRLAREYGIVQRYERLSRNDSTRPAGN